MFLIACLTTASATTAIAGTHVEGEQRAHAWTRNTAVSTPGAYRVVVRFKKRSGRKIGQDVARVTGADGTTRTFDLAKLANHMGQLTVGTTTRSLTLRFNVRKGKPVVAAVSAKRIKGGPSTIAVPSMTPPLFVPQAPQPLAPVPAPAPQSPAPRQLLFSDEFNGPTGALPASSAWDPQEGAGWGAGQLQRYTARLENVKIDGSGNLAITARKETYTGADGVQSSYSSARLQTRGRFSFTYGRVEARIKVPVGAGLWPAFWTLGDDVYSKGWPECGEIDMMEILGSDPSQLHGNVHGPSGAANDPGSDGAEWNRGAVFTSPTSLSAAFHVYAAEWGPGSIVLSIDGVVYFTIRKADLPASARWTFDHPNHLLLNLAVGGEWPGGPLPTTHFPATMLVDWVRAYAPVR
jgi:beta-glucanase (GH16 family)